MKYFAFLQTIIFLVPTFQPIINFLTFKNPIWWTIPRGLWPKKIVRYFYLKEPKSWKIYAWYSRATLDRDFFQKKLGSVFFNFLIQALLRPQIAIRRLAHISLVIFSKFEPLQIKISDNNYWGHNPLGIVNHIGF